MNRALNLKIFLNHKLLLSVIVAAVFLFSGSIPSSFAVSNPSQNTVSPMVPCTAKTVVATTSNTYRDSIYYQLKNTGTESGNSGGHPPVHAWACDTFEITGPVTTIVVTGVGYVGNYYQLWMTTDPTLKTDWTLLGTTPKVHTGPELVASSYNSLWDGAGTTYSSRTFTVSIASGKTVYFRVDDLLLVKMGALLDKPCSEKTLQLLSKGCSVTGVTVATNWNPGGYDIIFS